MKKLLQQLLKVISELILKPQTELDESVLGKDTETEEVIKNLLKLVNVVSVTKLKGM